MNGSAVVIGAGIGGLAAARALLRGGWDVSVLERAPALPMTGTTLALWPPAMAALDDLGIGDAVRREAGRLHSSSSVAGLRTPAGRTLVTTSGPRGLGLVSRPRLLALLARGVPVTFGTTVDGLRTSAAADVVVGADGVFSRTRDHLHGINYRARSLGAVAWRGTVAGTVGHYGETWAPGALFGLTPTGRDATNWYGCVRADHPSPGPHSEQLNRLFGSWHPQIRDVLSRVTEESLWHHELFESPRLPSYVSGHAALLGDAAHAMGPFLGRGAGEALVDGVSLGRHLAESRSVPEGLLGYDRERRPPTQRLVTASRTMGRLAMLSRGAGLRNTVLGGVGAALEAGRAGRAWRGPLPPSE